MTPPWPVRCIILPVLLFAAAPAALHAWGVEGHEIVNQVALASLPGDFPAWVRTPANSDRVIFLANEPDRWRDSKDKMMLHATAPDHEFNLEEIADAGMDLATLSPYRYEFEVEFAAARAAHEANFRPIDPKYNADHTGDLPGFLPWAIAEHYGRLQAAFSYLKVYEKYGTAQEVENARANVVYLMGVMGHFVGDGSQPLHVTKYYYGCTGPNPHGYVNRGGWHAWIDSGFIDRAGITPAELLPRVEAAVPVSVAPQPDGRDPVFVAVLDYLAATNRQVEPLYQLEKDGPLRMGGPPTAEGRAFIDDQLLRGGEMLGSLWLTAWRHAGPDFYLQSQLVRRNAAAP
jgi:hypothetical protein